MVNGMDSFVRKFRDYADCYTIIGGTACDILMSEADAEFRATRDIDMVLIMEASAKLSTASPTWRTRASGSVSGH